MAKKMTMHQELEMLRKEVEEFKKQKEEREKIEREEAKKAEEIQEQEAMQANTDAQTKLEEILETAEEGTEDGKKQILSDLLDGIQEDYKNLSPLSAVVLFSLGAAFGHAINTK